MKQSRVLSAELTLAEWLALSPDNIAVEQNGFTVAFSTDSALWHLSDYYVARCTYTETFLLPV